MATATRPPSTAPKAFLTSLSRTSGRERLAWAWLAGIVGVSAVVRYAFARRMPAPWIMVDEIIYSELAKSFADGGRFLLRGEPAGLAYGVVYPVLISPAYALFDAIPSAYAAVKAINAVLISLAAVPAYLLARTVLRSGLALLAAALSVAVPSMLYAGTVMTENAFYPLFLLATLALLRALERPTLARTAFLLGAVGLAFLTRAQAVALVPAIATAPLLFVFLERRGVRALGAYRVLYGAVGGLVALMLVAQAARGRSPVALLGAYRSAGEGSYDVGEVLKWLVYHVAELDLYLGVLPFAAFLLLLALGRRLEPQERLFLAAAAPVAAWLILLVSVFASRHALRIEERNMFYVAPLFLVALIVWIDRGLPRPRLAAGIAAGTAAVLPAFIPYEDLVNVTAQSDTLALLALWRVHTAGVGLGELWVPVLLGGAALSAVLVTLPRRYALVLPAVVLMLWVVALQPIEAGAQGVRRASAGALFQGITVADRDWIDAAVGRDASVAGVWSGRTDAFTVWETEFFNRSLGPIYHLRGPLPSGLADTQLVLDERTGLLLDPLGKEVRVRYAFADSAVELAGRALGRDDGRGTALYLVSGPLRRTQIAKGLYDDGWAGRTLVYTRYRCRGGTVVATLESDPSLFSRKQTVAAIAAGRLVATAEIAPGGRALLDIPLRQGPGDRCVARFVAARTEVPARVLPDSSDTRRLGFRVVAFEYRP